MIIHQTTDYSQFKKFASNRPTVVKTLLKSISQKNQLASHPIIVTKDFYIVDGQHRLECAKLLETPIYYIIDENIGEEDIPRQQIQKPWKLEDFQHFYKRYKENYIFMQKLIDDFHFPVHVLIAFTAKGPKQCQKYRSGNLEFLRSKEEIYKKISDLRSIMKLVNNILDGNYIYRDQLRAIWKLMHDSDYDNEMFKEKINKFPDHLQDAFKYQTSKAVYEKLRKNVYDRKRNPSKKYY